MERLGPVAKRPEPLCFQGFGPVVLVSPPIGGMLSGGCAARAMCAETLVIAGV